jgi:hypothetical protein
MSRPSSPTVRFMTDINNETTDGWTRLPTPTNNTTSGWDNIPSPPPLPSTVFEEPNHALLHWSHCYDDYCETHRHAKDNHNYHPRRAEGSRRRGPRRQQACECNVPHPYELANAIRIKHLNPRKACADWNKGKRVCKACGYLVRLEGHEERCGANTSLPAEVKTEEEEVGRMIDEQNEAPPAAAAPVAPDNEVPEDLAIEQNEVPDINNLIRTTAISQQQATISLIAAQRIIVDHQTQLAPRLERQDADHEQLGRMIHEVRQITVEQRRVTNQLNAQRRDWLDARLHASWIQRPSPFRAAPRRRTPNLDLAGASVWRGGVLSRIWRDRLLGAAAGAVITAAGLWVAAVSTATICWIFRR